ncbi:MAG: hypothetical protein KH828_02120 [Clostridiales bacterium]|nr:hypothetical protein [Clostridiales bacterium]
MAKKSILKTLAGLAIAGAAVGGVIAYAKKCKEVNDLSEEDFDDLLSEEESCECQSAKQAERTYTTLPAEDGEEASEETAETEEVTEETPEEEDAAPSENA